MLSLTPVAQQICEKRYFQKDKNGKIIENWEQLVSRVVKHVCKSENDDFKKFIYDLIHKTEFLPNSPCLVNAGRDTKSPGLLACFVTKSPEDSWLGMIDNIAHFGHVCRMGGGCGVDFSNIRPSGDTVFGSTHAKACGPIEHMRMVSEVMHSITQSGFRSMACLTYDTLISTKMGFIQLGEIVEQNMIGIGIHTQFGPAEITNAWHNGEKEVFELITEKGNKIKLTDDHKVYVIEKYNGKNHGKLSKKINEVGIWKEVKNLDLQNDCLIINLDEKPFSTKYQYVDGIKLDEKLASLISYTKCDGHFAKYNNCQRLELSLDSKESVEHFMNSNLVNFNQHYREAHDITILRKEGKSVEFMKKFGEFGTYHCDIPAEIFKSPKSVIASFLKSAFDAEGTVSVRKNNCSIITGMTSVEFINGIQILLGMFGIQSQLRRDIVHVNKDGILRHNMHYLSISNKWHVKKFMEEIGFLSNRKNNSAKKALKCMNYGTGRGKVSSSKIIHRIKSIQSLGKMPVYDISTTNETFLANNLVVHNCMSCLRVDHPDIEKFIVCKQRDNALKSLLKEDIFNHYDQLKDFSDNHINFILDKFISNFNISVFVTDDFMQKVEKNEDYDLVFNDKVYVTINARDIFNKIVHNAWKNGDPGMLFHDTINDAPYKYSKQTISATNPCFQGDSLVSVADGRGFVPIKQLASEKKDVPVYCCDPENGAIHIRWGRNPRKTRSNAPLCKVTFDDGGQITTTPDHKILLSNGKYIEVQNLNLGSSVKVMTKFQYVSHRSLYNGIVKGDGQSTKTEHKMIYEFYNNDIIIDTEHVTHHKDFNGLNNSITNLQKMSHSEHSTYHRQFNNPMTHWYPNATSEEKQKYHDVMSAAVSGEKNGMYGKIHSDNSKQKIGSKTAERYKDPEYKEKFIKSITHGWDDDKKKLAQSKQKKQDWQDGKYDNLKSEIITKKCEWCGNEFSRKSFLAEQLRFCSTECGNQIDVPDSEIIDNAFNFIEQYGVYPSVSTWETFDNAVCTRELIRTRFGNFQKLSERIIDLGIFAQISPNTKMTSKMIAAAIVAWTIKNGKEPSKKETIREICSSQSLSRNGGYGNLIIKANELCGSHSINHKVASVEMSNETEDVFNITVDDFHNLCIFSSEKRKSDKKHKRGSEEVSRYYAIVYKNCGEQTLPPYGSCNLGSIDVSKFYNENRSSMEWTRLGKSIETAIQFLDNVLSVNKFPTPDFAKWAKNNRPVGLGIMGWADLLLKMGITYGSEESLKFAHKLGRFFEETSHEKSVELGKERGTPKSCKYEELEHRRNVTTLSIAPTGTISLLAGCSSSIEPVFSAIIYRYDNTGSKEMRHPDAKKSWFKCASDLSWEEHVNMQSAFQPYIDSAISKCVTGDSLVLTRDGLQRIEDLSDNREEDSFSPLNIEVSNGRKTNQWRHTEDFYYGGKKRTIKIETKNGFVIEGTPNHKIKIFDNTDGEIRFKRLDELKSGQYCPIPFNTQCFGNITDLSEINQNSYGSSKYIKIPKQLNTDLSYLLGVISAEGSYNANDSVCITHCNTQILKELNEIFKSQFGIGGTISFDKRTKSVHKLTVNSRNLVKWMQNVVDIRRGAANKVIPSIILKSTQKNIASFLGGLFFDGYLTQTNYQGIKFGLCLDSESIIRDLQVILMNMGIVSNIIKKYNKEYDKYFYEILVYGDSLFKLRDLIVFRESHKQDILININTVKPNNYHLGMPLYLTEKVAYVVEHSTKNMNDFIEHSKNYRVKNAIYKTSSMKMSDIMAAFEYFGKNVWFETRVQNKLVKYNPIEWLHRYHDIDNCIYQEIVSIEKSEAEVFDIYVPDGNSFVANGFINHNTINMSNNATEEDVSNAYMAAWRNKCKGITIYRDGCKSTQVLNTQSKVAVGGNHAKPRPKEIKADIFKTVADGIEWHVIVGKLDNVPYEVFAVNGKQELPKTGTVVKRKRRHYSLLDDNNEVLIENIGVEENDIHPSIGLETRRFSLELRHSIDPKHIVAQIDKSNDVITSFSKAVGRIMKNKYISSADLQEVDMPCADCVKNGKIVQMISEAGCWKCPVCYNSLCG